VIDLHCHILPRIDDGAIDLKTAFKMAVIAYKDGIDTIVATPHVVDTPINMEKLKKSVKKLTMLINSKDINISILPGAEVSAFALSQIKDIKSYTINNSRYLLLEFPNINLPEYFDEIIFNLSAQEIVPVLAHPERNPEIINEPSRIEKFLKNNVLIQITAGSITGLFGTKIKKCAEYMLENNLVDIVASDAHSTRRRPPILSHAFKQVEKMLGHKVAQIYFYKNPRAIIEDRSIVK